MRIIIPTAGMIVGATVGAITYYGIAESGNAVATATHYGSYAIGKLAGKGITVLIGPTTGSLVESTTIGTGQACLVPIIRASSNRAALATAAAVGAASAIATALFIHGGTWIAKRAHSSLTRFLYQAPAEAPVRIKEGTGGFQVIDLLEDLNASCQHVEPKDPLPSV
jgi:hypothetical protein